MDAVTPLVQPLSLDEAFLDLSGTEKLHGQSAAVTLAKLLAEIERDIGITASAGLAPNKYLAKVASDMGKPRGYSVIGAAEAREFLKEKSVGLIWGVGKAMQDKLAKDGITRIGQLQTMELTVLMKRYGSMGARLYYLSRGEDVREVTSDEEAKSIGSETTFNTDVSDPEVLEGILWGLAQEVSRRAKKDGVAGYSVTLKLKSTDFKSRTRAARFDSPSNLAHRLFQAVRPLLLREATGEKFRLIGVSLSRIVATDALEETLDQSERNQTRVELAIDSLRAKFGRDALDKGLVRKGKDS
jgi:DNA polymerase IV